MKYDLFQLVFLVKILMVNFRIIITNKFPSWTNKGVQFSAGVI